MRLLNLLLLSLLLDHIEFSTFFNVSKKSLLFKSILKLKFSPKHNISLTSLGISISLKLTNHLFFIFSHSVF